MFRGRIKVMSIIALHSTLNISETVRCRGLVPKDHQIGNNYGVSNGHVADDVTWLPKVRWNSTVDYPNDSLASCYDCLYRSDRLTVHVLYLFKELAYVSLGRCQPVDELDSSWSRHSDLTPSTPALCLGV